LLGLATPAVAVLPPLSASLRSALPVVGKVATRCLAAFVAGTRGALAVIGEVAWIGFFGATPLSGPALIISHVGSPCDDGFGACNGAMP